MGHRQHILRATSRSSPVPWTWPVVFGLCAAFLYAWSGPGGTAFDQYKRLAESLLAGRLEIGQPPVALETVQVGRRHFIIPPPAPSILMVPYVAVAGARADQTRFAAAMGGLVAALALLIAARLAHRSRDRWVLAVLFAFGTTLWYAAAVGSVWFVGHMVATAGLSVAVLETLGRKRPWLIGAGLAVAMWSRLPTIMTLPFFVIMTADEWAPDGLRRWRTLRLGYLNSLAAPIAAVILLNFAYNWARFGTIADVAYGLAKDPRSALFPRGLFHPSYIPRHIGPFLVAGPRLLSHAPYVTWSLTGHALWFTTPAFLYALRAPLFGRLTLAAWAGIIPTALTVMSFGGTGIEQFGYRFAIDFYPLLFVLAAAGMRPPLGRLALALVGLSVVINLWSVVWLRLGWRVF